MLMAEALGMQKLALESRFLTNDLRVQNRPALVQAIEATTHIRPVAHWVDKLNELGVPCAPINTIDRLFDHPQLLARNMIVKVQGKSGRAVRTAGNPIKINRFVDFDPKTPIPAPALNQHREGILNELMTAAGAYAPAPAIEAEPPKSQTFTA